MNIIRVHRLSKFLAKTMLQAHQRDLVENFSEYQIRGLRDTAKKVKTDEEKSSDDMLFGPTFTAIQDEDDDPDSEDLCKGINLESIDAPKRKQLEDLASYFQNRQADSFDIRILYEVTGYQADQFDDWQDYDGKLNLLFRSVSD